MIETARSYDPGLLAARLRRFARLAHRALKDPAFRDRSADELSRHLALLDDQLEGQPQSDLALWVEHVRRALGPL
jgi:hypothetical protein